VKRDDKVFGFNFDITSFGKNKQRDNELSSLVFNAIENASRQRVKKQSQDRRDLVKRLVKKHGGTIVG
jgi:hypothetical protein